jgi:colicin import membrane protein
MSEKVVLPKFDIPSESAHPVVKAVAIVGALLLVSMLILGGAIWKRRAAQIAAEQQRDALIAARTAEANAVIEAAKARVAEAAAKEAAAKADAAAKIEAAKLAAAAAKAHPADGSNAAVADASGGHHHGHHGKAGAKGKGKGKGDSGAVAAKGSDDKKSAAKGGRDNAAIDKLLAQFK